MRILSSRTSSCVSPAVRHWGSPFLKIMIVGTLRTMYSAAMSGALSTSTLRMVASSPILALSCSRMGDCILQGPHHVAKKSTRVGFEEAMISLKSLIILMCFVV